MTPDDALILTVSTVVVFIACVWIVASYAAQKFAAANVKAVATVERNIAERAQFIMSQDAAMDVDKAYALARHQLFLEHDADAATRAANA